MNRNQLTIKSSYIVGHFVFISNDIVEPLDLGQGLSTMRQHLRVVQVLAEVVDRLLRGFQAAALSVVPEHIRLVLQIEFHSDSVLALIEGNLARQERLSIVESFSLIQNSTLFPVPMQLERIHFLRDDFRFLRDKRVGLVAFPSFLGSSWKLRRLS